VDAPPDLAGITARLETKRARDGSFRHLRESDLEDATFAAYSAEYETSPTKIVIPTPGWPSLGRSTTDLVVEQAGGSRQPRTIAELKWIVPDGPFKIWEAVWDLFKMALQSQIHGVTDAYLITGAPPKAWAADPCADIFQSKTHDIVDLCTRVFPTSHTGRLVWDELLDGGYGRHPDWVPSPILTEALPQAEVARDPDDQELRAVRVLVPEDHTLIPFPNGWPNGNRPPDARHPAT